MTALATSDASSPCGTGADQDVAAAPRADCIADSAGGLTFDVTDPGGKGAAYLLLRRRDAASADEDVRLPLSPAADGRLRAALPSSVELAEGRWNAYAEVGGGTPRRLAPGVNDLRSLVDRAPSGARGHIAVRIPYATKQGNLSVRSWLRAPHAEIGELRIEGTEVAAQGRVYGTTLTGAAYAEASRRAEPDRIERYELTADGVEFSFGLHCDVLADSGPGPWDLWLRPAGESGPRIRLARLLDDIPDKKQIFTYPVVRLDTAAHGPLEAGAYYTNDNDLSVRIREANTVEG
ncbi:FixH family protein [Streptomyces sp. BA2]|uniref:FixH family protein n=1 Tax=Streptomyces sp. BA2 TaxID=436595 RepID=UPI001F2FD3C1|nr:FixH family protein [Streptomyces sp. BA2]